MMLPKERLLLLDSGVKRVQIYHFSDTGYTESSTSNHTVDSTVFAGKVASVLALPKADRFRIDPVGNEIFSIKNAITYVNNGLFTREIVLNPLAIQVLRINDMESLGQLAWQPTGIDPYIEIALNNDLPPLASNIFIHLNILVVALITLLIIAFLQKTGPYRKNQKEDILLSHVKSNASFNWLSSSTILIGTLVACLVLVASILPVNGGPDEMHHVFSGAWYINHLFPPSLSGDAVRLSAYGNNYTLGNADLTYFIVAKFAAVLQYFSATPLLYAMRYTQIAFAALTLVLIARISGKEQAILLCVTILAVPQLAYAGMYFNGDFLNFLLAVLVMTIAASRSITPRISLFLILFISLQLKLHFLLILPVALIIWLNREDRLRIKDIYPAAIAGVIIGNWRRAWNILDPLISGISYREDQLANASPEIITRLTHGLDWSVLANLDWYISSAKSFYGVLGWMDFFLPTVHYLIGAAIVGWILLHGLSRRDYAVIGTAFGINLLASLWFSISYDFQPQGRYLFPALAVATALAMRRNEQSGSNGSIQTIGAMLLSLMAIASYLRFLTS